MLLTCEDRRFRGELVELDILDIEDIGAVIHDEVEGGGQDTIYQYGMVNGIGHMIIKAIFTPTNGDDIETTIEIDDLHGIPKDKKKDYIIGIYERNKIWIPNPPMADPKECIVYKTGEVVKLQAPFVELYAQITSYREGGTTCSWIEYCEEKGIGYLMVLEDYMPHEITETDIPKSTIYIDNMEGTPEDQKRERVKHFCEELSKLPLAKMLMQNTESEI